MAIYLKSEKRAFYTGTLLWASEEDGDLLRKALPMALRAEGSHFSRAGPWDCIGDILMCGLLEKKSYEATNGKNWNREVVVEMQNVDIFESQYFRPEVLLDFYIKLKPCGWRIIINNKEENMNGTFKMECPSFEDFITDNTQETGLLPVKGAMLPMNTSLSGLPGKHAREYSHPVDAAIVKVLDNPAVNTVFKSFVDMLVDANYGPLIASGIPVNENTFPVVDKIVDHCAKTLRIKRPYVVVSGSIGFNAVTAGSDEEPCIVLGNLLTSAMSEDQLRFVIGHECGHIAMGHMVYHNAVNTAGNLAASIPVVGPVIYNTAGFAIKAWSRRSEITADRAGMLCCGSLDLSKRTLMQLEMGFMRTDNLDVDSYVESSAKYRRGSVLRRVGELSAEHPILPKRIQALDAFANSELFYHVTNQIAPASAMSDHELVQTVENMIRVL